MGEDDKETDKEKKVKAIAEEIGKAVEKLGGYFDQYSKGDPPRRGKKPRMNNLCSRCTHSRFIRRASENDPTIICTYFERFRIDLNGSQMVVAHDIVECEGYEPEGQHTMSLREMSMLATLIQIDKTDSGHYL